MSAGKMLHTGNFVRSQTLKIRGNICHEPQSIIFNALEGQIENYDLNFNPELEKTVKEFI